MKALPFYVCATVLLTALTGCSSFSKSNRQQRAYQKYVQKQSGARAKQQTLFRKSDKPQMPAQGVSEPVESTSTGPEAVSDSSD
jgi:uncharacterized lipoprotein